MSILDLEQLLLPISEEAPCGENLEYDREFCEMERTAEATPEQQFGDTVVPGEDPDWRDLERKCTSLLERTKDLRVVVQLSQATLNSAGIQGFRGCTALLRGLVEQYWETVHPQLDPEDDNDPLIRVNTLAQLCDAESTLRMLHKSPLVRSRALGVFGLYDIEMATSDASDAEGTDAETERPGMATIEAAFLDCELDELQETAAAVQGAMEDITVLEDVLTGHVGVGRATSFEPLVRILKEADQVLTSQLQRRGVDDTSAEESTDGDSSGEGGDGAIGAATQRLTGEITSREDVLRALDKICEYYNRYEPSSPLPLLLTRAKRLATRSFLDIIRDLTPDSLSQAESLGGVSSESQEQEYE